MIPRLAALATRRAALLDEIGQERDRMAGAVRELRTQLALAGLGLLATRLLAGGGALLAAALPLVARLLPARH